MTSQRNPSPEVIRAKSFVVVGDNDEPIAVLGSQEGNPRLSMSGREGFSRLELGLYEGERLGFSLHDPNGTRRFEVRLAKDGSAYLMVFGQDGNERFRVGMNQHDDSELSLHGSKGQARITIGFDDNELPLLTLFDENGIKRLVAGMEGGSPDLTMFDRNQNRRLAAGLDSYDLAGFSLYSEDGEEQFLVDLDSENVPYLHMKGNWDSDHPILTLTNWLAQADFHVGLSTDGSPYVQKESWRSSDSE